MRLLKVRDYEISKMGMPSSNHLHNCAGRVLRTAQPKPHNPCTICDLGFSRRAVPAELALQCIEATQQQFMGRASAPAVDNMAGCRWTNAR